MLNVPDSTVCLREAFRCHQDISSENILVKERPLFGEYYPYIKLTDFGRSQFRKFQEARWMLDKYGTRENGLLKLRLRQKPVH